MLLYSWELVLSRTFQSLIVEKQRLTFLHVLAMLMQSAFIFFEKNVNSSIFNDNGGSPLKIPEGVSTVSCWGSNTRGKGSQGPRRKPGTKQGTDSWRFWVGLFHHFHHFLGIFCFKSWFKSPSACTERQSISERRASQKTRAVRAQVQCSASFWVYGSEQVCCLNVSRGQLCTSAYIVLLCFHSVVVLNLSFIYTCSMSFGSILLYKASDHSRKSRNQSSMYIIYSKYQRRITYIAMSL